MAHLITPDWPAPARVKSVITTRMGGVSAGPWESFNLATHVGDDPAAVAANRALLRGLPGLAGEPAWLSQVHGAEIRPAELAVSGPAICDGTYTRTPGLACVVLTADCLPLLFCDRDGSVVAAVHGGWRGLAAGIIRNTVAALGVPAEALLVFLGPAIGKRVFEVGGEVSDAFAANALDTAHREAQRDCFRPSPLRGKWLADLYGLARAELNAVGVTAVFGGDHCTFSEPARFYSYRRDGITGRMASLIWLAP